MKKLLIVFLFSATVFAQPPTVVTGPVTITASNTTAIMTGYINPNGTNTTAWFVYGVQPGYFPYTTGTAPASNGVLNIQVSQTVTGLLPGVTYYYAAQGFNGIDSVVTGATNTFAVTATGYAYNGDQLQSIDATRPQDSEPGSILGQVIRQLKAALLGWVNVQHNSDGTHKTGFLTTPMIADSAVTYQKLDPTVRNAISLNQTNNIYQLVTNALTYVTSHEYINPSFTTITGAGATMLDSISVASTNFRNVLITTEVLVNNTAGVNRYISLTFTTNGMAGASFCCIEVPPLAGTMVPFSWIVPTKGNVLINVGVVGNSDATATAPMNAKIQTFRAFGIP